MMLTRNERNSAKKQKVNRILLRIVLPAVLITIMLLGVGFVFLKRHLEDPRQVFKVDYDEDEDLEWLQHFDEDVINILILGFDENVARRDIYYVFRPDTIMVASMNYRTNEVILVSIPRDSYVMIHGTGGGYDKINAAYYYGYSLSGDKDPDESGMETTVKTVRDFLGGVPLHFYVAVCMDGVAKIVDTLDGFYYDVDVEVRANFGRGRLLLEKGYQHIDGRKFLYYVRDRGNPGGDFGRVTRQQQILIEAFSQLRKQGRLNDIPEVYRSLKEYVKTNLSVTQMASLALFGTKVVPGSIETYYFPGDIQYAPRGELDIPYVVINEVERVRLIKEIFGVEVELRPQITLPGRRQPVEEETPPPSPSPAPLPEPSDHFIDDSSGHNGGDG